MSLPQGRAPLDVGQQEGQRPVGSPAAPSPPGPAPPGPPPPRPVCRGVAWGVARLPRRRRGRPPPAPGPRTSRATVSARGRLRPRSRSLTSASSAAPARPGASGRAGGLARTRSRSAKPEEGSPLGMRPACPRRVGVQPAPPDTRLRPHQYSTGGGQVPGASVSKGVSCGVGNAYRRPGQAQTTGQDAPTKQDRFWTTGAA